MIDLTDIPILSLIILTPLVGALLLAFIPGQNLRAIRWTDRWSFSWGLLIPSPVAATRIRWRHFAVTQPARGSSRCQQPWPIIRAFFVALPTE